MSKDKISSHMGNLMIIKTNNNKRAIIILHEIYGINKFIEAICAEYYNLGYDIYCPDMHKGNCFSYSESFKAYDYFINGAGFDFYKAIEKLLIRLKTIYDKVFILGFSVGATIAWRCCESVGCDGVICYYGSRIRDYLTHQPACPVLLLFAELDSFDVDNVVKQLQGKSHVEIYKLQAQHGFMDQYSNCFNGEQARISKEHVINFLNG